jgi:hypothetical protein
MAGNTTANTQALARRDVYSSIILDEITEGFLPEGLARDVSDFPDGSKLLIPTFGEVVIKDVVEDQETPVDAIDTGRIELEITEHKGAGISITDENREDGYYIQQFDAAAPGKMLHGLKEVYETDLLETGEKGQTQGDPNQINGFAHRWVASGTNGQLGLSDFAYAKTVFQKAKVPDMGIIAIVDPISEMALNRLTNIANVSNNPTFQGMVETGFGKNMRFIRNIFGVDVYMSNRLPRVASETIDTTANGGVPAPETETGQQAGDKTATNAYAAQFMVVSDDMTTPYMSAWRRQPSVTYFRDEPRRRDIYYVTTRYGFAMQRPQTLATCLVSMTAY